jgi:nucleoside phosphorylase
MTGPGGERRVAVLAPMRSELRPLVGPLGLARSRSGDRDLYTGAIGRLEVVAALAGIGTRAAARATERVLDAGAVDRVVVVGIAGGIGPDVAIGDLVVPDLVVDVASGARHRPTPLGTAEPRGTLATSDALVAEREAVACLAA